VRAQFVPRYSATETVPTPWANAEDLRERISDLVSLAGVSRSRAIWEPISLGIGTYTN
jgi:hypothetical protein